MRDKKKTEKKLEKAISSIGAKIADANDINDEITCLSEKSGHKLDVAQEELSELYLSLDELEEEAKKH